MQHPFFADIITYKPALEALARLGYRQPTFSDGYIISKPPHSPRLFWHYDWFAWEERRNYEPEPPQVFPHGTTCTIPAAKTAACA